MQIDDLAQEIRRVDGNHSLGAGALAEALMPFIAALSSAEEKAVEVSVKPLEWREMPVPPAGESLASSTVGLYCIPHSGDRFYLRFRDKRVLGDFSTLAKAKAAAQQDYETRIRSALVDVPAVESEPVAVGIGIFRGGEMIGCVPGITTLDDEFRLPEDTDERNPLYVHPPRSSLIQSDEGETVYRWRGPRGGWIYDDKPPKWNHETLVVRPTLSRKTAAPGDGSAIGTKGCADE